MSDPYVYPDTDVLINKLGIRDRDRLEAAERLFVTERLISPLPKVALSYEGYKALHRHLFQDVYEWAGEARTVNIAKRDDMFCLAPYIDGEMTRRFEKLAAENNLKGLSVAKFAARAAEHICEINAIHPFREGNGRTQQLFLEVLAARAGHRFDRALVSREAWNEASREGFRGSYDPMARVIKRALRERDRDISQER